MSRVVPIVLFSAALFVLSATQPRAAHAQSAVPAYFFKEWTVNRDCTEAHAGRGGHTTPGMKFRVVRNKLAGEESYSLQAVNDGKRRVAREWQSVKLEYRAGARMSGIPADMECVPGQEASSPFLAMSGFTSSAEPYYGYEHWYGLVTIHGEAHHLLIFPLNRDGASSAAIVLIDADAGSNLQLDHNGTIIVEN